jgi:hypothetical protein
MELWSVMASLMVYGALVCYDQSHGVWSSGLLWPVSWCMELWSVMASLMVYGALVSYGQSHGVWPCLFYVPYSKVSLHHSFSNVFGTLLNCSGGVCSLKVSAWDWVYYRNVWSGSPYNK